MRKRHWRLSNFRKETKVRTLNFKTFFKVAAVLAVLLTSSYSCVFNNTQSYETGIAQTKTFRLPDNSEVLLNASKITFNEKNGKTTELTLDGEAYFQVKGKHSAYRLLMVL
jgi:ferric-dicitrate binding protein FerR (iron transport regulator)